MSQRDYERPGIDDKSGMLPPKLAKIMINLNTTNKQKIKLLDPFCGSGTVLTEAAVMGYTDLVGSDISEKAVADTEKNLNWLKEKYQLSQIKSKFITSDVQKLSDHLPAKSIDIIVTEPYLGKPLHGNESENYLEKQSNELKNLYIQAFQELYKILKSNGEIIIAIPKFKTKNNWIAIDCTEEIKNIGFKIIPFEDKNSLLYHRPNQHLGREIWRFKKNKSL